MIDAQLSIRAAGAVKTVALADYLDSAAEDRAHEASYTWIKSLRHLPVDGTAFRDRFTAREDSLWWFTELYLHKEQVILDIHRAIAALTALLDTEGPAEVTPVTGSHAVRHLTRQIAAGRGVRCEAALHSQAWLRRLAAIDIRARRLMLTSFASVDRWKRTPDTPGPVEIAAFIHRAFWRTGSDGSSESYIGPILSELERRLGTQAVRYIGLGPATNFRSRRPWRPLGGAAVPSVTPVERYASWPALAESRAAWRERLSRYRILSRTPSLRDASRVEGIDCWPLIREQLAGVAWLQWPWSVRAMDEAAAALDALNPRAVVTYAEAGGWGRALLLESRRRGIPSGGLQHGFIYRHWLNYRHEPDEMEPARTPPFPHPSRTLLFDAYAARHLRELGRFPPATLLITGSPRLDELARDIALLAADDGVRLRHDLGIAVDDLIVLVTTKEKEARDSLGGLVDAAARLPGVSVVIKPHPAETAEAYARFLQGRTAVRVVSERAPLARLLAAARALVTVNSTVALDAGVLGLPTMVIGLPNNLSPFVAAGAMAGSADPADVPALLERILYDEGFRQQLAEGRRTVLGETTSTREHRAASKSAEALIELSRVDRNGATE